MMADSQNKEVGGLLSEKTSMPNPPKRPLATRILLFIVPNIIVSVFITASFIPRESSFFFSTPALADTQFHLSFARSIICALLLWQYTLWVNKQNKHCQAVRNHLLTQPTDPMPTPRFFWLLPHIQTPRRRASAIIACALIMPLQILALYFSFQGVWEASSNAFKCTFSTGNCMNGTLLPGRAHPPWPWTTAVSFGVYAVWYYAIDWTALWLVVHISFIFSLCG